MGKKLNVAILFGGKSAEHEVALQSARNIIQNIDRNKYNITLIGIDKEGCWHLHDEANYLLHADDPKAIELGPKKDCVALIPQDAAKELISLVDPKKEHPIDLVFPVLHGPFGEDGTVQGFLKLAGIPFVGADVLGSAICMDKDISKRLLRDAGIPIADFLVLEKHNRDALSFEQVVERLSLPFFVKPANLGSSIGITKVKNREQWDHALELAFSYDRKILIERMIPGREIQFAVIGNEEPITSLPCSIVPRGEFHSYISKYIDAQGSEFIIPVPLEKPLLEKMQKMAIHAYKTLCCEGMARVDMFLTPEGECYLNEINTIPGLTRISPYSKMWIASGYSMTQIIDLLIQYALSRFQDQRELRSDLPDLEEILC